MTWRLLDGKRSDRLYAALRRGISKAVVGNLWVLGLISILTLAGCTLFGGGPTAGSDQSLTQIHWCDRKNVNFIDESAPTAAPLTNWADVKDQLGFTYYLPSSLPKGACLMFVGGKIHDSVFNGGMFSITYNLPASGPLVFSETPKLSNASTNVQCLQSALDAKTNICQGVVGETNVTIASRLSTDALQNYYPSLKSNLAWVPAVEPTAAPSPTVTPTPKS